MGATADVLERKVIHAREVFIEKGEENCRAYMIQSGMVRSFSHDEQGNKIEVALHGPGTIIGEVCLVLDTQNKLGFEAVEDSVVVTITRQDFEKKMTRVDSTVKTVFKHAMRKLSELENMALDRATEKAEIDNQTYDLVNILLNGLSSEKKFRYEKAIVPHVNNLIKTLKSLKSEEKDKAEHDTDNAGLSQ